MRWLVRVIVSDWRRKLLALGLAFAVWLWLSGLIAVEQKHALRIVVTNAERAVEPGTLQVRVPDGWTMTGGPGRGAVDMFEFALVGSAARIEAFLTNGFSARFDPQLERLPENRDYQEVTVRASDLTWTRPDSAREMLAFEEKDVELKFEFDRLSTMELVLGPHVLRLQGQPPDGYVTLEKEMSFGVNQVRLRGPARMMDATIRKLAEAQLAYEEYLITGNPAAMEGLPALLEPLVIHQQNRNDIHTRLRLNSEYMGKGLELLEGDVLVTLPVRLSDPTPRPFTPDQSLLTIIPDPENQWEAPEWVPPSMRYVLTSRPLIAEDVNEEWLNRHLLLFLPLDRIPDSALELEEFPLQIEWTLVGLEPDVKLEVLRRLSVVFEDPAKRTVMVRRRQ